jgi:hypothetical protein
MHCLVISFVANNCSSPSVLKRKYLKNTLFNSEYISVYFGCFKNIKSPFWVPERPMAFFTRQDCLISTYFLLARLVQQRLEVLGGVGGQGHRALEQLRLWAREMPADAMSAR